MPRPLEFYTQNPAKRKPSPGGCAPRSESKIYMTAGGSHTSTKWPQSGRMRGGRGYQCSTGQSLPLEGKVVRPKPDRMRSKVAVLYQLMVIIGSFDLIRRN